jgi:hypothetical protein
VKTLVAFALALCLSTGLTRAADTEAEKHAAVLRLMEVTGMTKMVDQMMEQMIGGLKSSSKELSPEFFEIFKKKANGKDLIALIIPIYEKYYSVEELKAVTAFYESAAGQKVLSTMPQVMQEAAKIGEEWGGRIGREAAEEVQAKKKKTKL